MKRLAQLILLIAAFIPFVYSASAADWQSAEVPGDQKFTGYAWYRTWVKPHPSYFSGHERDLWGESTLIGIKGVPGAHEAFVNGKKIGIGGAFPPNFEDGAKGNYRHKIPPGTLVKDQWNEIAFRMYVKEGAAGFVTEAPFMMNYFWEVVFAGKWEFRKGDEPSWAGKALKEKPASSSFEKFHESNRILGRTDKLVRGKKMSPADSLAKMRPHKDFEVDLLVSEPLVAQPTHFSFDSRGRLWVSQYRQYPYPAGLKMLSRDKYYRSHYDRVPPAPPNHDKGADIVSIHEDSNGDGKFDKHKVFQDGLNMANSAIRGRGGVWVMNTPYLLFYPDKDFDDVPDGPPVVHLSGFGLEDTHSVANGLVWGADGWLYGAQGSTCTCRIRRPGIDAPDSEGVYFQGCMVWRYHPESRRFELFAEGGGNNFGLELDDNGRIYTGHNGGTTRGFHYVQGGYYLMQGKSPNKYGPPRNPYSFGELPKMASEQKIIRFTHFAALGEGTAIPKRYHHSFFGVDPLHNFVIASKRVDAGATFTTTDLDKVLECDDFAFRPVYIGNAPDGSMFVADFYEHYIAHGQHYQSQIDPDTGRIFRLRGKGMKLETDLNLEDKTSAELIKLLGHPNKWHRHTAVRLLGERKDKSVHASLQEIISSGLGLEARCALWAHYQAYGLDQKTAITALRSPDAAVRYWTVRFLTDDIGFKHKRSTVGLVDSLGGTQVSERLNNTLMEALLEQARYEGSLEVRSQMASSARRLSAAQGLALVRNVLSHDSVSDQYVPLLCWWVFDAKADSDREAVMKMFDDRDFWELPMVKEHILPRIMRRLASQSRNRDLLDCAKLLEIAPSKDHSAQLLKGFEEGFKGRSMDGLPETLAKALVDSGISSLILKLRLRDPSAIQTAVRQVTDAKTKKQDRLAAIRTLGELKVVSATTALLNTGLRDSDETMQKAALAALSAYSAQSVSKTVIAGFDKLNDSVKPAAYDLLLSRMTWTRDLLDSIERGEIDKSGVDGEVVRRLKQHADDGIQNAAKQVFAKQAIEAGHNFKKQIADLESVLQAGSGNPYAGESTFMTRCGVCHKLFHKGGSIGPDLTPYQRNDLNTMLISIVNPNAEIREGFEYVSLETSDGRSLSGFLTDQDNQIVALRGMAGEDIRVARKEVKSLKPMGRSLMPEGLLAQLKDQELRDFFAYLKISQPISR